MIILVDLSEGIANLEMLLVMIHPVLLAAVDRDAAVGAFEVDLARFHITSLRLLAFGARRQFGRFMVRVRAISILAHEGGSSSELGDWGVGEGVKEVVLCQLDVVGRGRLVRVFEAEGRRRLRRVFSDSRCCGRCTGCRLGGLLGRGRDL